MLEATLPYVLQLFFVAYPLVTNVAFDAFSGVEASCEYLGCTDSTSSEYNPSAIVYNGCAGASAARRRRLDDHVGCVDPIASNFDSAATSNSGCEYNVDGCADSTALNYLHSTMDETNTFR